MGWQRPRNLDKKGRSLNLIQQTCDKMKFHANLKTFPFIVCCLNGFWDNIWFIEKWRAWKPKQKTGEFLMCSPLFSPSFFNLLHIHFSSPSNPFNGFSRNFLQEGTTAESPETFIFTTRHELHKSGRFSIHMLLGTHTEILQDKNSQDVGFPLLNMHCFQVVCLWTAWTVISLSLHKIWKYFVVLLLFLSSA